MRGNNNAELGRARCGSHLSLFALNDPEKRETGDLTAAAARPPLNPGEILQNVDDALAFLRLRLLIISPSVVKRWPVGYPICFYIIRSKINS